MLLLHAYEILAHEHCDSNTKHRGRKFVINENCFFVSFLKYPHISMCASNYSLQYYEHREHVDLS